MPSLQKRGPISHTASSGDLRAAHSGLSTPTSPWKSIFRIGNSSSKKLVVTGNGDPLMLDTAFIPSTPATPHPLLTPGSFVSMDQRYSYNSSTTQSSDSNNDKLLATPPDATGHLANASTDASLDKGDRSRSKSERQQTLGNGHRNPPASLANSISQSSSSSGPRSPRPPPLSPRSVSASATRFIRRVASAPNAKNLFHLGARPSMATTTKNGLLAPAEIIPPVPGGGVPTSVPVSENGTSSIETVSSTSSRGRPPRFLSTPGLPRVAEGSTSAHGPGKVAFRRTYSSNSIKVKSVSIVCRHRVSRDSR